MQDAINDPGCKQKITKVVNVVETPNTLICNDLVYVSMDEDCKVTLGADDVLEGTYFCYGDYIYEGPGRDKLVTRSLAIGSPATANTIGITVVACFAETTLAVPDVTITSTFCDTSSAARPGKRSLRASPQRPSYTMSLPST